MGIILVHSVVDEFILLIGGGLLERLSLLVIDLAVVVAWHDRALLIDVLLSLSVHRGRTIDAFSHIVMMLLKMVYLLISRVSRTHCLLPAPHIVRDDLSSISVCALAF